MSTSFKVSNYIKAVTADQNFAGSEYFGLQLMGEETNFAFNQASFDKFTLAHDFVEHPIWEGTNVFSAPLGLCILGECFAMGIRAGAVNSWSGIADIMHQGNSEIFEYKRDHEYPQTVRPFFSAIRTYQGYEDGELMGFPWSDSFTHLPDWDGFNLFDDEDDQYFELRSTFAHYLDSHPELTQAHLTAAERAFSYGVWFHDEYLIGEIGDAIQSVVTQFFTCVKLLRYLNHEQGTGIYGEQGNFYGFTGFLDHAGNYVISSNPKETYIEVEMIGKLYRFEPMTNTLKQNELITKTLEDLAYRWFYEGNWKDEQAEQAYCEGKASEVVEECDQWDEDKEEKRQRRMAWRY